MKRFDITDPDVFKKNKHHNFTEKIAKCEVYLKDYFQLTLKRCLVISSLNFHIQNNM